jgi:hypothetical protein
MNKELAMSRGLPFLLSVVLLWQFASAGGVSIGLARMAFV